MGRLVFDDAGGSHPKSADGAGKQQAATIQGQGTHGTGPKRRAGHAATDVHPHGRKLNTRQHEQPGPRPNAATQQKHSKEAAPSKGSKRKQDSAEDTEFYRRALKRMEMGPMNDNDEDSISDLLEDEMPPPQHQHQQRTQPNQKGNGFQPARPSKGMANAKALNQQPTTNLLLRPVTAKNQDDDGRSDLSDGDDADLGAGVGHSSDQEGESEEGEDQSEDGEEDEAEEDEDEDDSQVSSDDDGDPNGAMAQLSELPLETRLALLQDGSGPQGQVARAAAQAAKVQEAAFKRLNRHRPQEMSSKRPVSRFREIVEPARKTSKDPRFSRLQSDTDKEAAARRYAFLYDDVLAKEKAELRGKIKAERKPGAKAVLAAQLQRVDQALARESQRRTRNEVEAKFKVQQRGAVAAGKTPYFLKAADKKKLELLAKYEQLKSKGKLDRFMEKRRKHNASKDHRYLPSGRRGDEQDV